MVKAFSRPGKIREFEKRSKIREFENTFWKNQGKSSVRHARFILAVLFLNVDGESVAVRAGMEATFKNENHVFLVGDGSFLLRVSAGKSWKILEISWKNQGI